MNQRDSTLFAQRVLPNNYNALESLLGPNLFSLSHEFYFSKTITGQISIFHVWKQILVEYYISCDKVRYNTLSIVGYGCSRDAAVVVSCPHVTL